MLAAAGRVTPSSSETPRSPTPQSAGGLTSQTANRKACLSVSVGVGETVGGPTLEVGARGHASDQSSQAQSRPYRPGTQASRDDTAAEVVLW